MADQIQVGWTTVERQEQAIALAREAVAQRLAVCAQVDAPCQSFFLWEGKATSAEEVRIWLKFLPSQAEALGAWLQSAHPYDTPQWIVVGSAEVGSGYAAWARACAGE